MCGRVCAAPRVPVGDRLPVDGEPPRWIVVGVSDGACAKERTLLIRPPPQACGRRALRVGAARAADVGAQSFESGHSCKREACLDGIEKLRTAYIYKYACIYVYVYI